tara:strand:+ start:32400 stop:35420 length:3021 start_codon:yes stop_codon:yes gene_type:complete
MVGSLLKRFSGRNYKKFYKTSRPLVTRINELETQYQNLSDAEFKAKTGEFRDRITAGETLDDILPEAFAAVKNAARRLCGTEIEYAGTKDVWNMIHYDVQLMGGMALHQHTIAEMQTGEGKTLVATLPLYLNALSGNNCQLVTVNEYLAQRDGEWMGHLYRYLGLSVGVIKGSHQMTPAEKREAYACDITYGTASEFGFDYLRDNGMSTQPEALVQKDHFFCIIDEVDSVLVDEARTPLIISGPVDNDSSAPFIALKPDIDSLVRNQNQLCNRFVGDAKTEIEKGDDCDAEFALNKMLLTHWGAPKNKILRRLLEDPSTRKQFESHDLEMGADFNRKKKYALKEQLYYTIDEKQRSSDLTQIGRDLLRPDNPDGFVLPDLPTHYMEIDADASLNDDAKAKSKADAQSEFEKTSEEIHIISQLLRAYSLYERDVEYVVQDGKVMIVDENTGRVMPGRRWSDGLHQAVEAKEGVQIERESRTFASITLQNYFRLYEKLAGMTGTAETEANEFKDIYNLDVMVIPTNQPNVRIDENDIIFKTRREKYNAVIEEIEEANKRGQPCLVGTVSVDASELLSRMMKRKKIDHSVLNAKYHAQEAEIVANAGQRGSVTIATNMAGRGTDIKLGDGINDLGGLYVIGTERHTSRRIDRQLRGRCARQGDPGRTRFFISLEDELMRLYSQGSAGKLLQSSFEEGEPLEHRWLNPMIERAQKTVEQHHYSMRKRLLQYDDVASQHREVVYGLRQDAMLSDDPKAIIFELVEEELESRLDDAGGVDGKALHAEAVETVLAWAQQSFPIVIDEEKLATSVTYSGLMEAILEAVREAYSLKEKAGSSDALRKLERIVIISTIDRHYQEHLTEMEDLRQSVGLRGYGQKDPLVEYKNEAYKVFSELMAQIRGDICTGIFRSIVNLAAFEQMMLRNQQRAQASGPSEAGDGDKDGTAPAARTPDGKPINLPKIKRRPPPPVVNTPGRNETVKIRRGEEELELKWKKAERMVKDEGWQLLSEK